MSNTLVALYRKVFPEDDRSDNQLTLDLAKQYPDRFAQFPDAQADFDRLQKELAEPAPLTAGDYISNAVSRGVRGAAAPVASAFKSLGTTAKYLESQYGPLLVPSDEEAGLTKIGKGIEGAAEAVTPEPDPRLAKSFLASTVPAALGSSAGFMVGGAAGRLAKIPELAGIAGLGAASGFTSGYEDAKAAGADEDTAMKSALLNAGIGTSEILPLARMLKRLDGITKKAFTKTLLEAGKESFEEGLQEAAQQFGQNWIAKKLYDKDRDLLEELKPNAGAGAVTGFLYSLLTHTIGQKRGARAGTKLQNAQTSEGEATDSSGAQAGVIPPLDQAAPPIPTATEMANVRPEQEQETIRQIIARELSGEHTPELERALNAIYSSGDVGFYQLEKRRMTEQLIEQEREKANAERVRSDTGQPVETGQVIEGGETDSGGDLQQAAPGESKPVGEGAPAAPAAPILQPPVEQVVTPLAPVIPYRSKSAVSLDDIDEALAAREPVKAPEPNATVAPVVESKEATTTEAAAAPSPPQGGDAVPNIQQVKAISPAEFVNLVDFDRSKVAGEGVKTGLGQKNAEAFTETSDPNELYKDRGANTSNKNLSRKLGVFVSESTGQVLIGTASQNVGKKDKSGKRPLQRQISTHSGRVTYDDWIAAGWKQVASIKTTEPTNGFAVTYSTQEWGEIAEQLRALKMGAQGTAVAMERHITGVVGPAAVEEGEAEPDEDAGVELPARTGTAAQRAMAEVETDTAQVAGKDIEVAKLVKSIEIGSFSEAHAGTIFDEFGGGEISAGDAVDLIGDLIGDKADAPRVAILSLLHGLEKNYGYKNQAEAAAHAAEIISGSAGADVARTEFTSRLVAASQRTGAAAQGATAAQPANNPATANAQRTGATPAPGGERGGGAAEVKAAAAQTDPNPTDAQKAAGNYQKGSVKIGKLDITIENAKGSTRSGTDASGKPWAVVMPTEYGYIKRSEGKDGDHVDVYIGPKPDVGVVYVIDQIDPSTKKFDEHKAMMGFESREQAMAAYLAAFSDNSGASRLGEITRLTQEDFENWIEKGNTTKPIAYGKTFQGSDVRKYRQGDTEGPERARYAAAAYHAALDSLAAAGLNVQLITEQAGQALQEFGSYDNSEQLIQATVADLMNPTADNFTTLVHEAAHALFLNESEERQAMLQRSIDTMSDGSLKIDGYHPRLAEGLTPQQAAAITSEERLVEATARKLTAEGWRADEAKGAIQGIIRLVKDLWYRATLWIQRARFGQQHTNPDLARRYFENRLRSLLAGDAQMSFLNFIGGRKLTFAEEVGAYPAIDGAGMPTGRFNFETGAVEHPEPLPSNVAAIRFRDPQFANDPESQLARDLDSTVLASRDVAAQNNIEDGLRGMFDQWNALGHNTTGLTFEQFVQSGNFVDIDELPAEFIARRNDELAKLGQPQVNPRTKVADLPSPSLQQRAATVAQGLWYRLRAALDTRRAEEEWSLSASNPRNLSDKLARANQRLVNVQNRSNNADFVRDDMKRQIQGMWQEFKDDVKAVRGSARKAGVITQTIRSLEQRMDRPLERQYAVAIDKLYTKLSGNTAEADHFVDTLQRVAEIQTIDWENDSAVKIRQFIRTMAQAGEPLLQTLIHEDVNSRALFSVVVSFGRTNADVMDHLFLRRSDALTERATINAALKLAMNESASDVAEARRMVNRLPRLAVVADRLLNRLEKVKVEHRDLMDEIHRARTFIDFHQESMPVLREHLARLETVNGSSVAQFDTRDGAPYFVPVNPNGKFDLTWRDVAGVKTLVSSTNMAVRKELQLKANGHLTAELLAEMEKMDAWLKAQPADQHGSTWNYIKQQHDKLSWLDKGFEHEALQQNIVTRVIGSITDKLAMIGHPATNEAARMIRQMNFWIDSYGRGRDLQVVSNRWETAEGKAMKALGWRGGLDAFRLMFYDRANKHVEDRQDISARQANPDAASQDLLTSLRAYLERDPDTTAYLARPGAWTALEKYYRASWQAAALEDSFRKGMGGKILDSGPDYEFYRESIGGPGTVRRTWSDLSGRIYRAMLPDWVGTGTPKLTAASMADAYRTDPNALKMGLQGRFTPTVWKDFVRALAYRAGRSLFNAPLRNDGYVPLALRERVIKAFEAARPGDAVGFAEQLYRLEGGTGDVADFVGETLETFQKWFDVLHLEHAETNQATGRGVPMPRRALMDARRAEEAPAEWLSYRRYDGQSMKQTVKAMAFHAAGGRNLEAIYSNFDTAIHELNGLASQYRQLVADVQATGLTGKKLREGLQTEATRRGLSLSLLENAQRNKAQAEAMKRAFEGLAKSQLDLPMEFRPFMELIHTMASMAVQGPGTALTDTASLATQPFRHYGISKQAFKDVAGHYKYVLENAFGSLGWIFNKQWNLDIEANNRLAELGLTDSDPFLRLKEKVSALTHEPIQGLPQGSGRSLAGRIATGLARGAVLGSRALRLIPSTGIGRAKTEGFAYPSLKVLGVFNQLAASQHGAVVKQAWDRTGSLLARMVQFYESHPTEAADATYQMTAKQAGYSDRGFDYVKNSLQGSGLDIEQQARKVMNERRTNPHTPVLSMDQYRAIAIGAINEVMLESNFTTRPAGFLNNPVLAAASPLVGWGVSSLADAAKQFAEPNGKAAWNSLKGGWGGLLGFAATLPLGLAYAWLRDEYDERLQGKKANVQGFGANNNFLAALDKLNRAGQLFGTAGDIANAVLNQDTNRPFSVDSRVLFVSATLNALNAVGTAIRQGSTDYASVYRPLMTALGGNGYLQYADVLNNVLSLDNQEARVTARISVGNYLRAAGRELQLDVRTGRGQASVATPMKPYVSQMVLAAYANDHVGFREAYRNAIEEAREMGKADPAKSVADSYAAYHPLRAVFRTEPTPEEYRKALNVMDEQGRVAVASSIRLFNAYGEQLGVKSHEGRKAKPKTAAPNYSLGDLRARATAF